MPRRKVSVSFMSVSSAGDGIPETGVSSHTVNTSERPALKGFENDGIDFLLSLYTVENTVIGAGCLGALWDYVGCEVPTKSKPHKAF
jgi:hypothetical protein